MGMPRASVSTDRFTPSLPRSVGFFPVFFPTQRRLGLRPVQTLPSPRDAASAVVAFQLRLPQPLEDAQRGPLLKVAMDRAAGAVVRRHGLPLAAGAEYVKDAVHHLAQVGSRPSAARR